MSNRIRAWINKLNDIRYDEAVNLEYPIECVLGDGSTKTWRRPLRSSDILKFFKLGGTNGNGPIHPDAEGADWIGDTLVMVRPSAKSIHYKPLVGRKDVKRRVLAMCNRCGKIVCPGHLHQHRGGRSCMKTD